MIKISCEGCGREYKIDPNMIKSEKTKFTCRDCGHVNYLGKYISEPPEAVEEAPADEAARQETASVQTIPFKNRLQFKLNAVLIVLILIIMGAFTVYNYVTVRQSMTKELQKEAAIVSQRLSTYLVEAFWSLDDDILSQSLKSEMTEKNIYAINLLDRDGKTVYMGYRRDAAWQLVPDKKPVKGPYIVKRSAITKDGDQLGTAQVFFTSRFVDKEFRKTMLNIIITAAVLLLAVSLSTVFVVKQMVTTPIGNLTDLANKISVGNLEVTIPKESNDEIGVLAEAFERMRYSMVFAIKQLRKK